jgi:DNA polymerase III delta prime subunit
MLGGNTLIQKTESIIIDNNIMDEILDRTEITNQIKTLLNNFNKNQDNLAYKKGIYIYGSAGCGKTHFIKKLLKEMNYDTIHYDAGDCRNKILIETITSNNISNKNVLTMMCKKIKNIAIVMDEIDGMNNGDKGSITALIKLIRQKKTKKQKLESKTINPIICIGNYYQDKKIKELMKVCNVFELKKPTDEQILKILKLKIPINPENELPILNYIQGDLRKLDFIYKIYNKNPNLINDDKIQKIFHLKTNSDDSKRITQSFIQKPTAFNEHHLSMNDTDRTIVALLWHENIIDAITLFEKNTPIHKPRKYTFPLYLKILENICFADYIDRITFQNQIWQFNEMSSLIKTFYTNKIYHEFLGKNNSVSPLLPEIRFTKVLTKYSTEYNNILFIYNLCNEMDLDKKDLISFFQESRLYFGNDFLLKNDLLIQFERMINNANINKLDIKRMYRYLDKNEKKETDTNILEDDLLEMDESPENINPFYEK